MININMFKQIIFLALFFTLLSCSMKTNYSQKNDKINNVQFNIQKKLGVIIKQW